MSTLCQCLCTFTPFQAFDTFQQLNLGAHFSSMRGQTTLQFALVISKTIAAEKCR